MNRRKSCVVKKNCNVSTWKTATVHTGKRKMMIFDVADGQFSAVQMAERCHSSSYPQNGKCKCECWCLVYKKKIEISYHSTNDSVCECVSLYQFICCFILCSERKQREKRDKKFF